MPEEECIIVFAKAAQPGAVKTRLIPHLTPKQAADFHLAALADTLAAARRATHGPVELHVAGGADEEYRRLHPGLTVRSQEGDDLGARLSHAFSTAFERGATRALIVGSDHPTLAPQLLSELLSAADTADVAWGPSRDGGYYAIAIRRDHWPAAEAVLRNIPWSTDQVLAASLERARAAGLSIALAAEWYDVDSPEDLERLRRDAAPDSECARFFRRLAGGRAARDNR